MEVTGKYGGYTVYTSNMEYKYCMVVQFITVSAMYVYVCVRVWTCTHTSSQIQL